MYRDADEVVSFGAEAPVLAGRLRALLEHLGIITVPRYRIKEVLHLGRVEFKAIEEIFFGSRVLCRHKVAKLHLILSFLATTLLCILHEVCIILASTDFSSKSVPHLQNPNS
jgi:hypothetical protein